MLSVWKESLLAEFHNKYFYSTSMEASKQFQYCKAILIVDDTRYFKVWPL